MKEERKMIFKKENGEVTEIARAEEVRVPNDVARKIHLCWKCDCASPLQCSKVEDIVKKEIEEYPFITDGYQIFTKDGKLDEMVVTGCDNFVPERKVYLSKYDRKRIQEARDQLSMFYFGVNSVEEARRLKKEKRAVYDEERRQENLAKRRIKKKNIGE
mgnify:FL=1